MKNTRQGESGQALVLIILAIVGIMGFSAMAIDLGRVYSERRRAQNAADAASMAWAFAAAWQSNLSSTTAVNSLALNDYRDVPGRTQISLNHPPADGPYAGNLEYFQVKIAATVDQVLGQFVYPGPYNLTVEAIARAKPIESIMPGKALVAMGRDVCPGIVFNGGAVTAVNGGGIYSNSNGNGPGSCYSGLTTGSSGTINVVNGEIEVAAGWSSSGGATINPAPQPFAGHTDFPEVPVPVCPSTVERSENDTPGTLRPGVYRSEVRINNGNWTMEPGMYCFYDDFTVNGGSLRGEGVMIVMYQGSISMSGNADIYLKRPNDIVDGSVPQPEHFGGMLIYMPEDNQGGIDLSGNNGTVYVGTIYAPGPRNPASQEKCNIGGANKSMGLSASVMCHTVGIAGNANVTINYKEEQNYRISPRVELSQ